MTHRSPAINRLCESIEERHGVSFASILRYQALFDDGDQAVSFGVFHKLCIYKISKR